MRFLNPKTRSGWIFSLALILFTWMHSLNWASAELTLNPMLQGPEVTPVFPNLIISGFSDINFSSTDESDTNSGFNQGQFILHFRSALSSKVNVFAETSLTVREDDVKTGLERIFIRLDQSDYLKMSLGRFHTPIDWWNTAFHHGMWLQTSIRRPEMTDFGGQFIPVHFVGGLLEGWVPSGGLNLHYTAGLGNGRDESISGAGGAGDVNDHRAWLIDLFIKPDHPFGLQAGGSFYRDKITPDAGREIEEWILAGHVVWQREDPEVIGEIARVHHNEEGAGGSFNNLAYYVQVAYRLPWWGAAWKPYYRFEYNNIPADDPAFDRDRYNRTSSIGGLRFDFTYLAAAKLEYRNQKPPDKSRIHGVFGQVSFTF